jgi:hypothetical protein
MEKHFLEYAATALERKTCIQQASDVQSALKNCLLDRCKPDGGRLLAQEVPREVRQRGRKKANEVAAKAWGWADAARGYGHAASGFARIAD